MHLHGVCYYRSRSDEWTDKWRDEDYAAMNLVKAVKRLHFGGTSVIRQGEARYSVNNTAAGQQTALTIASRSLAGKIQRAGYQSASLIPVPSSSHTNPAALFTGRRISEAVQAAHAPFISMPILFFDQAMPPARGGGSRNPTAIQPHLRLAGPPPASRVVLIDDVCTSGGHLIAAARYLRQHGVEVEDAFVIGRTRWERPESMWSVATEQLTTRELFDF